MFCKFYQDIFKNMIYLLFQKLQKLPVRRTDRQMSYTVFISILYGFFYEFKSHTIFICIEIITSAKFHQVIFKILNWICLKQLQKSPASQTDLIKLIRNLIPRRFLYLKIELLVTFLWIRKYLFSSHGSCSL